MKLALVSLLQLISLKLCFSLIQKPQKYPFHKSKKFGQLCKPSNARRDIRLKAVDNSLAFVEGINGQAIKLTNIGNSAIRGVVALENIDNTKPILQIPANLALEVTNDRPPTPFPEFVNQKLWENSLWYQRLAYKLLYEYIIKPDESKQGWFKTLPSSFTTPFHWSSEEISSLQYDYLSIKIQQQRQDWQAFYQSFTSQSSSTSSASKTASSNSISYEQFIWALESINSRAFSGPYEGSNAKQRSSLLIFTGFLTIAMPALTLSSYEQSLSAAFIVALSIFLRDFIFLKVAKLKRYVVCPVMDMFNHDSRQGSRYEVSYNYFANSFELLPSSSSSIAPSSYQAGEQIFITYGKQSNDRLLQYYGFVEDSNPYDLYDFTVNMIDLLVKDARKYGEVLAERVPFPQSNSVTSEDSPVGRIQRLAKLLVNTQMEETTTTTAATSSSSSISSSTKDITVKLYRSKCASKRGSNNNSNLPSLASSSSSKVTTTTIVDAVSASASATSLKDRFDDLSVYILRGMYCTAEEWKQCLLASSADSLQAFAQPLSVLTERSIDQALQVIVTEELARKPTSLNEDLLQLSKLQVVVKDDKEEDKIKGFGSSKKDSPNDSSTTVDEKKTISSSKTNSSKKGDPSGEFASREIAALSFRIEKKKLLSVALSAI